MKKRIFSVFLAVIMAIGLIPSFTINAIAADEVIVGSSDQLKNAINAATDGVPIIIKLSEDINLNSESLGILKNYKKIILDLNGKMLTSNTNTIVINSNASLEIKDTSVGATGVLSSSGATVISSNGASSITVSSGTVTTSDNNSNAVSTIFNLGNGTVNVSGGTVSMVSTTSKNNMSTIYTERGNVNISGGTVSLTCNSSNNLGAISNGYGNGNVTISGGIVSANKGYAVNNRYSGRVTVSDGIVAAPDGGILNSESGIVTVSGGTVSSQGGHAITNMKNGTINISGGTIFSIGSNNAINSVNNTNSIGTVKISGGNLGMVRAQRLELSGNPILKVSLVNLEGSKFSITDTLTGEDGSIALDKKGLLNTKLGTVVATATNADYAVASKFVSYPNDQAVVKSDGNLVFAEAATASAIWADGITSVTDKWDNGGEITTAEELAQFAYNVNHGQNYSGKTIILGNDISLSGKEWTPIGIYSLDGNYKPFKGIFDGNGKKIIGVTIGLSTSPNKTLSSSGLFGMIQDATIKNLGVDGTIYSSLVDTFVEDTKVGGLVGINIKGTIINCYSIGNVTGGRGSKNYVGGLVGMNSRGTITGCYAIGNVSIGDGHNSFVGGLVGYNEYGTITNCYASGNISGGNGGVSVGGLVGSSIGATRTITNCYATGDVQCGNGTFVPNYNAGAGGLVGFNYGSITNTYATGNCTGGAFAYVGGMVGVNWYSEPITIGYWNKDAMHTVNSVAVVTAAKLSIGGHNIINSGINLTSMTSNDMKASDLVATLNSNVNELADPELFKWQMKENGYPIFLIGDTPTQIQTYTVAYNANGGTGTVVSQTTNTGTETTVSENGFTKNGYRFSGWNTKSNGSGTSYMKSSTVPSQIAGTTLILYAQWTENTTYSVSGTVYDSTNSPAFNASVKLMKGNKQIGTQNVKTALDGTFTIADVQNGTYNLVVEKEDIIVTTKVVVSSSDYTLSDVINLPIGKTNSVVEVKENTPDIVVGNLDGQFSTLATDNDKGVTYMDNAVVTSGGSVEIRFIAEKKDNTATNATTISAIAASSGKTVGIFIDLSVQKMVKNSGGAEVTSQSAILTELPSLIDVFIPLPIELQGKSNYVVYRYHDSNVDSITTMVNADKEKIELVDNNTTIKLTVKKFSTYAIAYATPPSGDNGGGSSGGGSNSSEVASKITTEQNKGGKITIRDDKKTTDIIPDNGYVIVDVTIDGESIGATEKYIFKDSKAHIINAVFVKEIALPYYNQNEEKVYIGFSAIAGSLYKYIAPNGVIVEFRENPKNFTDNTIAWAKPSIDFVTEREIFLGTSQNIFSPNESMTRAMFVTVIGRLYERSYGSISGTSTFSDVNENAYYAKYVAWANENSIIKGIGENKFAPEDNVTREQMSVIMLNFATFLDKADVTDSSLEYADSIRISSWAIDGAKYCQETKVITGREGGKFVPQGNATRAEVAAVIERFIKTMVK